MESRLDVERDKIRQRTDKEVLAAIEYELEGSIAHAGGVLTGFSVRLGPADCLFTLRAVLSGRPMVAFVGAPDIYNGFRRCVTEAHHDGLKWKEDKWASG